MSGGLDRMAKGAGAPGSWRLALGGLIFALAALAPGQADPSRWETAIARLEAADKESPPPERPVVFVGSSSIRLWDVEARFPGLTVLNRGFGGSQIVDSVYYADRIILKYRPRAIVFYAGDNDIAAGKSPQAVVEDFAALLAKIESAQPDCPIFFLSLKPSLARWALFDQMKEANRRIGALATGHPQLHFVDVAGPMLGPDGRPRSELFVDDGLHLNEAGYTLWTDILRPRLEKLVRGTRTP